MTGTGEDGDLQEFLNRGSAVSRRYRSMATEEPAPDLDRAVLAQARAAVEALPPEVIPGRSRTRWGVPFALAASILLSFAIFREAGVGTGVVISEESAPAQAIDTPEIAELKSAETRDQAEPSAQAPAELARAASPAAAPSPAAPPPSVPPTIAAEASASKAVEPAMSPPSAPALAAATAVPQLAPTSDAQQAFAGRTRNAADASREERTPEVWLEEIRKLRAGGETAAADAQLQRFLEANPGYFDRNPDVARP